MTATVYYDNANQLATLAALFTSSGSPADPTTVSCVVTDPSGTSTTYTVTSGQIVRIGTGSYTLPVSCAPATAGADGLWGGIWIGTGAVSDIQPSTWRVMPEATSQWYIGLEEFKDRLAITDSADDSQCQIAIQSATSAVNEHCGRHFWRVTETRTYQPDNIWTLDVDDIVPGTPIQVNVDLVGDGVFRTPYTQNVDYQLRLGYHRYNVNASGLVRPYRQLQIINSGNWWPFTWPWSHLDRVQIATTFGWNSVPSTIVQGTFLIAAQLFRLKDAAFGVGGGSTFGTSVRSQQWAASSLIQGDATLNQMFWSFTDPRRKVGC